jgi:hypothetical protein
MLALMQMLSACLCVADIRAAGRAGEPTSFTHFALRDNENFRRP